MNNQKNLLQISQTPEQPLAEVDFINRGSFDVGEFPNSVVVGEFNSDTFLDLAITNRISDNVSILLGNANGGFSNANNIEVGNGPTSIALGDFNSDGISDLAVTNTNILGVGDIIGVSCTEYDCSDIYSYIYNSSISILLGNGDGSFNNANNIPIGDSPDAVAVSDFNGDRISDLVVADENLSILFGNGDGSFSNATEIDAIEDPNLVVVEDFNGDGISDLAVNNRLNLSLLLGNGDGSFGNTIEVIGTRIYSLAVGELNGDGLSDLAVIDDYDGQSNKISVLLNNRDGSFRTIDFDQDENRFDSLAIADFNGDNFSDLAVARWDNDKVSLFFGNGNGDFSNTKDFDLVDLGDTFYSSLIRGFSLAVADFNRDGNSDLAAIDKFHDQVFVLINATPVAARGAIVIQGEALGSENNDLVSGSEIDDTFFALAGDDVVSTRAGNDEVNGNRGNDIISGGRGNDRLHGGRNLDYILGDDGNDSIFGERDSDTLKGGRGADTIYGGKQNDELGGEEANDLISGDLGDDTLSGDAGNDTLMGENGNDILSGGRGADVITGGEGSDTFIFNDSTFERDEITDFASTQGDMIILDRRTFSVIDIELGNGFIIPSEFATVTNDELAETVDAFIVYNSENGNLFYNNNGSEPGFGNFNGSEYTNLFVTLTNTPLLTAADFFISLQRFSD